MKNILVAGDDGYIGSHMCKHLASNGFQPILLNNLVHGRRKAVQWGPLIDADMADEKASNQIFSD